MARARRFDNATKIAGYLVALKERVGSSAWQVEAIRAGYPSQEQTRCKDQTLPSRHREELAQDSRAGEGTPSAAVLSCRVPRESGVT